jgi:hypothetical protein
MPIRRETGNILTRFFALILRATGVVCALRQWDEDSAMCTEQTTAPTLLGWLRDPMIRLVMDSDGVTEKEMIALVRRIRLAVAARPDTLPELSRLPVHEGRAGW